MEFAVIFDMDGVFVDSHKAIWDSHNEVLGYYGAHLSDEDIKQYLGKSLRDDIVAWNKKYGLNLDLETHTKASWEIQLRILGEMKPDSGLVALLEDLKSHNILMGVGTSSQRFRAEKILEILNIRDYFSTVVSANDVELHKPNPELFLEVAKRLRVGPRRCVVIEDAQSGIESAIRGMMYAIGYSNGHNDYEELMGSDLVISNFSQVSYERIRRMVYDN